MIRLSEQSPLGTGRHRKCYAHPEDAQRCIKIVYHRGDGGDKEIRRELKYYAHLGRRLKDWSGIPRYHGTVETDCGTGYVYDVIADFDGKPSITLTEFAEQCRYEEDIAQVIPVVCDNIGESTLIPLATWSKWCCLRKQERLWKRFIAQPALAIALQKDLQPRESKTLALTSREA